MGQQLKLLRKLLNLNQSQFAEKIGIKQGSLSDIERGKVKLSNANSILICKTFNVNEKWLKEGTGDPFNDQYSNRNDLSDLEKDILIKFNSLDDQDRKSIENIINSLYQKAVQNKISQEQVSQNTRKKDNDFSNELAEDISLASAVQKAEEEYIKSISITAKKKAMPVSNTTESVIREA